VALADAFGSLIDFRLRPGQAHDLRGTAALIEGLSCRQLPAGRAFDANRLRKALAEAGIEAVIPPESSRRLPAKSDRETRTWRHLTGTFLAKLKEYGGYRPALLQDRPSCSAFVAIGATVIRLR